MTLYGTLLSLAVEPADGDAVVAGVGAALEPTVIVDVNHLTDTEPVRADGIGDHVEPRLAQGVLYVVLEPRLGGEQVAAEPERPRLVEGRLRVQAVIDEVRERLHLALRLHGPADHAEDGLGPFVATNEAGDDRVEGALAPLDGVRIAGVEREAVAAVLQERATGPDPGPEGEEHRRDEADGHAVG